jgi:hypothetical protein
MKKSSSSHDLVDIMVGCQLQTKNEKKITRVTFHVEPTFATGKVCLLQLKHFRESFLHRYACFSRRTYVAVFSKKRLRQCEARKVLISGSSH